MAEGFTIKDKLACLQRELDLRKRVYPRWVQAGRMSEHTSLRQIALMQAIVDEYEERAAAAQRAMGTQGELL